MDGRDRKPEDLRDLRRFFLKAAFDKDFRKKLKSDTGYNEDEQAVIDAVDTAFRDVKDETPVERRWEPPASLCRELASWTAWLDEYDVVRKSPPFEHMYVVVRHAMPLHATVEEDGAAG